MTGTSSSAANSTPLAANITEADKSNKRILIFPAGMPRSLSFLERALAEGQSVIGSSSLAYDTARDRYPLWVHLPYVTSPDFLDVLAQAITDFNIGGIYTPNAVVWDFLNRALETTPLGVRLVSQSPSDVEMAPYKDALRFAGSVLSQPALTTSKKAAAQVGLLEIASLFRHAEAIPGMCDHDKIRALFEIFRHAPKGDVVEIGSWWGKSAFIINRLAQIYDTGSLLCVDPWSKEHIVQQDEKGLVDQVAVDTDEALTVFQLNLLPYANGTLNYLRLPSVDASSVYRSEKRATSETFGTTEFTGRISVLHIDGNHSYAGARSDIDAWGDLVAPGGWIIFDDYVWPYGDGPQRVGDEYLQAHGENIELAFVMGSALFIRLKVAD